MQGRGSKLGVRKRVTVLFLSFCLITLSVAALAQNQGPIDQPASPFDARLPVDEITSLRTDCSKSYANPDGSITAIISAGPIHYKDDRGAWQDIDTTLSAVSDLRFILRADSLNLDARGGGPIIFSDASGGPVAAIPVAFAEDAEASRLDGIELPALAQSDGSYTIFVPLDQEWLAKAKYPVVLDPNTVPFFDTEDGYPYFIIPTYYAWNTTSPYVLISTLPGCVKFDVGNLGLGAIPSSVTVKLVRDTSFAAGGSVTMSEIDPCYSPLTGIIRELPDLGQTLDTEVWGYVYTVFDFPASAFEVVQRWSAWSNTNYGLAWTLTEGSAPAFRSREYSVTEDRPTLTVTYTVDTTPPTVQVHTTQQYARPNGPIAFSWEGSDSETPITNVGWSQNASQTTPPAPPGGSWLGYGLQPGQISGNQSCTVPGDATTGQTYHAYAFVSGGGGMSSIGESEAVTIDADPPTVSIESPHISQPGASLWLVPGSHPGIAIEGLAEDGLSGISQSTVRINFGDGSGFRNVSSYDPQTHIWTYSWTDYSFDVDYLVEVTAFDGAGNPATVYRREIRVLNEDGGSAIESILNLPDSTPVQLRGKVVTIGNDWMPGAFYIEDAPGAIGSSGWFADAGIKVVGAGSVSQRDIVDIAGVMATASGQRYVQASSVQVMPNALVLPQTGVSTADELAALPNAVGRRVVTCGMITAISGDVASLHISGDLGTQDIIMDSSGLVTERRPLFELNQRFWCEGVVITSMTVMPTMAFVMGSDDACIGLTTVDFPCAGFLTSSGVTGSPGAPVSGNILIHDWRGYWWGCDDVVGSSEDDVSEQPYRFMYDASPFLPEPLVYGWWPAPPLGPSVWVHSRTGGLSTCEGGPAGVTSKVTTTQICTTTMRNGHHIYVRGGAASATCDMNASGYLSDYHNCTGFTVDNMIILQPAGHWRYLTHKQENESLPIDIFLHDGLANPYTTVTAHIQGIGRLCPSGTILTTSNANSNGDSTLFWDTTGFPLGLYYYWVEASHQEPYWHVEVDEGDHLLEPYYDWSSLPTQVIDLDKSYTDRIQPGVGSSVVIDDGVSTFSATITYDVGAAPAADCRLRVVRMPLGEVVEERQVSPDPGPHQEEFLLPKGVCGEYFFIISALDSHRELDKSSRYQPGLVSGTSICAPRITILGPSGLLGGTAYVRVQVECPDSSAGGYLELKAHENTTLHEWSWISIGSEIESQQTVNGIRTTIYRGIWPTVASNAHNGSYTVRASFHADAMDTDEATVEVKNLVVTDVDPPDHITWDGTTTPQVITVTIEDNDLNDPTDITLTLYSCGEEDLLYPAFSRVLNPTSGANGVYTFNWDGKDDLGNDAAPGAYTYEVDITQMDTNGPHQVEDYVTYRSTYLMLGRAYDENGPIMECDFDHYDDKGTPEETDDDYVYLVRWYMLGDYGNIWASEGTLKMYDPDMQPVTQWDVAALTDLAAPSGLAADWWGVVHELLVPVPVGMMAERGIYRFVMDAIDEHAVDYRDHRFDRRSLSLNGQRLVYGVNFYYGGGLDGTKTGGTSEAWADIKGCVLLAPDGRRYPIAKGYEMRDGKLVTMSSMPENADAPVVLSGLRYGNHGGAGDGICALCARLRRNIHGQGDASTQVFDQ